MRKLLRFTSALAIFATSLSVLSSSINVYAEENTGYRYAVQIWGIEHDSLENGSIGGLTFGPAIGAAYYNDYQRHDATGYTKSGNAHRCIHDDDWSDIIQWNDTDPYVYEDCVTERCTHSVEMTFTEANTASGTTFKVENTMKVTGDGIGEWRDEMQHDAKLWATHVGDDLNWANSQVRAMLNGVQDETTLAYGGTQYNSSNCFLSAFPEELQNAIGRKAVKYAVSYDNYTDVGTTYDKLWLFSAVEVYGDSLADGDARKYVNEGNQYARTKGLTDNCRNLLPWYVRDFKDEKGIVPLSSSSCFLRSFHGDMAGRVSAIALDNDVARWGFLAQDGVIAPGFVLSRNTVKAPTSVDAVDTGSPCHHNYEWEVYKKATATTDGIMRYRCKYCGTVEYEVPTAAYYIFNKETQESIQNAAVNATVNISTPIFISFHEMVKDALVARPDVTLVISYRYSGNNYEMTIPAGSGDVLSQLFGDGQYAGFLYLGGAFVTVAK